MISSNMHNCYSSHHYPNPLHRDHALQASLTHFFFSNHPSSLTLSLSNSTLGTEKEASTPHLLSPLSSPLVSRSGMQLTKLARKGAIMEGKNGGGGRTVPQCFSSFTRPFLSPISSSPLCSPSTMSGRTANLLSESSNNSRMTEIAISRGDSSSSSKNESFRK
uniref:Uncharacterized protein n=1 Tax=Polytomella parva TaxID=51329 RepID=A0A7S0UMT6_9CHLO|mmetsp:Transcript_15181/g.26955  ORF Transcript_15181/g.26955 Transcript_15181/m.26955 type:complete len:163 (+) Transcript_15181:63-551(+)